MNDTTPVITNSFPFVRRIFIALSTILLLPSCVTYPTLQQVAMMRQNPGKKTDDLSAVYRIADLDVINYTNRVKETLSKHFKADSALRYGSSTAQVTLAALAGAAATAGWAASTASGFGMASAYVFSLGQRLDAKGKAQTYEQAFTAVQGAEATYYFYRLGMGFKKEDGRTIVMRGDPNGRSDIPSRTHFTPDGETLYYRVSKVLKVLNDVLASKIPDLQDLKEAHGESSASGSPAKTIDALPASRIQSGSGVRSGSKGGESIPYLPPARGKEKIPDLPAPRHAGDIPDLPAERKNSSSTPKSPATNSETIESLPPTRTKPSK